MTNVGTASCAASNPESGLGRVGWSTAQEDLAEGTWVIDYDDRREDDDEVGFRLDTHLFRPGEYVSLADEDGELQTYRVVSVR